MAPRDDRKVKPQLYLCMYVCLENSNNEELILFLALYERFS